MVARRRRRMPSAMSNGRLPATVHFLHRSRTARSAIYWHYSNALAESWVVYLLIRYYECSYRCPLYSERDHFAASPRNAAMGHSRLENAELYTRQCPRCTESEEIAASMRNDAVDYAQMVSDQLDIVLLARTRVKTVTSHLMACQAATASLNRPKPSSTSNVAPFLRIG